MTSSRKKCRKIMLKIIRHINKSFEHDDWFNGCYYIRMIKEYSYKEAGNDLYVWYLAFIDKKNPLNTYLYRTHSIAEYKYFDKETQKYVKEYDDPTFAYGDISKALNSWIQFCESGTVHDSPSNCDYAWPICEKTRNNIINRLGQELPKDKIDTVKNIIKTFNTSNSFTYSSFDSSCKKISSDNPVQLAVSKSTNDKYAVSGYSWAFNNSINLLNDDNKLMAMIVKVSNQFYIVLYDTYENYKPNFHNKQYIPLSYKIDIEKICQEDESFNCWLIMNNYNINIEYLDDRRIF